VNQLTSNRIGHHPKPGFDDRPLTFWRVEGSLLNLSAVHPVAYFTWNAQRFSERWKRRGGLFLLALIRPLLYATNRVFATRVLHTLLRGVSRDRLDLLGEEYFNYVLKPKLREASIAKLKELQDRGERIVLVSQALDHVLRPLADHLGVEYLIANRLEFREGLATGKLLSPVIRPRQFLARIIGRSIDGRVPKDRLIRNLGFNRAENLLLEARSSSKRIPPAAAPSLVLFEPHHQVNQLSVRQAMSGKNILLIGFTGFIGKVWVAKILRDLPEIGKIYLLIRNQRSTTADRRFEKIVEESPIFDEFYERHKEELPQYLSDKIEIICGDTTLPGLGLAPDVKRRLASQLDLIVNSSGLTDFNPDLRLALSINVDGTINILDFMRECAKARLLHLSTCYVVGFRDGRIHEQLVSNYNPLGRMDFSAESEYQYLKELVAETEARAESPEVTEELEAQLRARKQKQQSENEHAAQLRKARSRWLRSELTEVGMRRSAELGWPNTYTLTKSLAESLIAERGSDLSIAIVRPSIVETSTIDPFRGWNEGVNTSAPLSYLLGTYFRQLPSNEKKCLDIIPVDLVSRGMLLIAAALIEGRHDRLYQLATSAVNPCNMRRSIELTGLAHRKHYRAQSEFEYRLLSMFDSISVSKERYQKLSAPRQKALVQALLRITAPLPMARSPLIRRERDLDRVEKLIKLYEPFILHNVYVFEAKNVELLAAQIPPEEQAQFGYDARNIDWWEYWINIHIPALRRWSYPIIEGRPTKTGSRREFRMPGGDHPIAVVVPPARLADEKVGS
jgi:long-chain acyl-CoA synthetase